MDGKSPAVHELILTAALNARKLSPAVVKSAAADPARWPVGVKPFFRCCGSQGRGDGSGWRQNNNTALVFGSESLFGGRRDVIC